MDGSAAVGSAPLSLLPAVDAPMPLAEIAVHPSLVVASPLAQQVALTAESASPEAPPISPPSTDDMALSQPDLGATVPEQDAKSDVPLTQQDHSVGQSGAAELAPEDKTSAAEDAVEEPSSRPSDAEDAHVHTAGDDNVQIVSVEDAVGQDGHADGSNGQERTAELQDSSVAVSEEQSDVVMTSATPEEGAGGGADTVAATATATATVTATTTAAAAATVAAVAASPEQPKSDEASPTIQESHSPSPVVEPEPGNSHDATMTETKTAAGADLDAPTGHQSSSPETASIKWVTELLRVLQTFKKLGREQFKQLGVPRCGRCEKIGTNRKADVKCLEATCLLRDGHMCWDCWSATHCSPATKAHCRTASAMCPQCRLDRVAFWCSECDLTFCSECFSSVHSVQKVMHHRKFAMEGMGTTHRLKVKVRIAVSELTATFFLWCYCPIGAPGSFLTKANWSQNFQAGIIEMIAARKTSKGTAGSSTTVAAPSVTKNKTDDTVGEKRKRAAKGADVIVIDDSDDDGNEQDTARKSWGDLRRQSVDDPPLSVEMSAPRETGDSRAALSQQHGATNFEAQPAGHASGSEVYAALQPAAERAQLARSVLHASVPVTRVTEPIPFPPELMRTDTSSTGPFSLAHGQLPPYASPFASPLASPSMARANTADSSNNVTNGSQLSWSSYSEPQIPMASMPPSIPSNRMDYGMHGMASEPMNLQQQHASAPVSLSSGMWSSSSSVSTDLATNNTMPLGGMVFAENALVDAMTDRYNEANGEALRMEMEVDTLTKEIAAATYQGSYTASQLMGQLNDLQVRLNVTKTQREQLMISMIIQSNDIMAAVRGLRLAELGDVPQVPALGHRKCFRLSFNINRQKRALVQLNQYMANMLNEANQPNGHALSERIQCVSSDIRTREQKIQQLKQDREAEIVRMVQFCHSLREGLKAEFQHNYRRRQEQQQHAMPSSYR